MTKKSVNPFIISKNNSAHKRVIKRQGSEGTFKKLGLLSILVSMVFLAFLLYTIFSSGWKSFLTTEVAVTIDISSDISATDSKAKKLANLENINLRKSLNDGLKTEFPNAKNRRDVIQIYSLISRNSYIFVKDKLIDDINDNNNIDLSDYTVWVPAASDIDIFAKNNLSNYELKPTSKISQKQIEYIEKLRESGKIKTKFNSRFITSGDSREPELAGIYGSIVGSFFVILICMLCALPLGVAAAIYLEEFAPKNKITTLIEITVNNLAAVPSIVYGLLGLALYIQFFEFQRSAALVGGLTLALLVLPIMIITTRNSLSAVPPSIKDAAIGLGASKMQVLFHHTLPLSLPGIMTGSILSIARALGETAPLLMIGMVAFVKDIPQSVTDPSTALPVQIYIWSDLPEQGFAEKTSGAIIILLLFLVLANALAVYLRKKYEYKW